MLAHPRTAAACLLAAALCLPALATAGWGYTVECATQAIRMVLSGVFDKHPKLQMILGPF